MRGDGKREGQDAEGGRQGKGGRVEIAGGTGQTARRDDGGRKRKVCTQ